MYQNFPKRSWVREYITINHTTQNEAEAAFNELLKNGKIVESVLLGLGDNKTQSYAYQ